MDATLPDDVQQQLERMQSAVEGLKAELRPFLDLKQIDLNAEDPLEQAEVHLAVARGLASLYSLYIRTAGIPDQKFSRELDRLERYQKKVAKAVNDKELATTKRSTMLDIAAANRFIDAAIPELSQEQKAALRKRKLAAEQSNTAKRQQAQNKPAAEEAEAASEAAKMADEVLRGMFGKQ